MREIGSDSHMKRVSKVSKARRYGVLFSLPVVSWALLLLLLLSSTFSHRHDSGGRGAEEAPFDMHGLELDRTGDKTLAHVTDAHNPVPGNGEGDSEHRRSCSHLEVPSEHHTLEKSDASELLVGLKDGEREWPADRSHFPRAIPQSYGDPINALEYSEYGAGLLQKSGVAEESSKICLVGNPAGIHCTMVSDSREFLDQHCIPSSETHSSFLCTNEFLAEDHCQRVDSHGGPLKPGESFLVCRSDGVTGSVFCQLACSSSSQCFLSGVDSKRCRNDRSLSGLFRHTAEWHHARVDSRPSTEPSAMPNRAPDLSDSEDIRALGPAETSPEDLVLSPIRERRTSDSGDGRSEPEAEPMGKNLLHEGNAEKDHDPATAPVVVGSHYSAAVEDMAHSVTEIDAQRVDSERNDDALQLLPVVYSEKPPLGERREPGELGASPQVNHGLALEDEFLFEQIQSIFETQDEVLNAAESLAKAGVEKKLAIEPGRRLKRVGSVMSLDEYKRSILEKQQKLGSDVNLSSVQTHKMRHSDESYNYAASSHGSKVLSCNKEAKGASHIITSDKDKYLRNPCSAEDKFVVIELSEETFVDTVVISNFEFHSANLKDFEVFGSPVYPAKDWISLGRFQAENVRHRQKFTIEDPKLVRYLMIKMLTHWGSEFFCTLSVVEVFGVDVIKNLLDDWIALEEGENGGRGQLNGHGIHHEENTSESLPGGSTASLDAPLIESLGTQSVVEVAASSEGIPREETSRAGDVPTEVVHVGGGGKKTPGDSVLKILMQKVKALELNQSLFDLYLEDMNHKYKAMLSELDKDLAQITERLRNETALAAALAIRLAEVELKRREDKLESEQKFALIASNFTENIDFMRWQIQRMERREITAVMLALFGLIISALLHLLARCLPRRMPTKDCMLRSDQVAGQIHEPVDSCSVASLCKGSSLMILYLGSGLTILVLSV